MMKASTDHFIEWARRRRYDFADPAEISRLAAEAVATGTDTEEILAMATTMNPSEDIDSLIQDAPRANDIADPPAAARKTEAERVCRGINDGTIRPLDGVRALTKLFSEDESDADLEVFWRLNAETDDLDDREELEDQIRQASAEYRV